MAIYAFTLAMEGAPGLVREGLLELEDMGPFSVLKSNFLDFDDPQFPNCMIGPECDQEIPEQ